MNHVSSLPVNVKHAVFVDKTKVMDLASGCWVEIGLVEKDPVFDYFQDCCLKRGDAVILVISYFCFWNACEI